MYATQWISFFNPTSELLSKFQNNITKHPFGKFSTQDIQSKTTQTEIYGRGFFFLKKTSYFPSKIGHSAKSLNCLFNSDDFEMQFEGSLAAGPKKKNNWKNIAHQWMLCILSGARPVSFQDQMNK